MTSAKPIMSSKDMIKSYLILFFLASQACFAMDDDFDINDTLRQMSTFDRGFIKKIRLDDLSYKELFDTNDIQDLLNDTCPTAAHLTLNENHTSEILKQDPKPHQSANIVNDDLDNAPITNAANDPSHQPNFRTPSINQRPTSNIPCLIMGVPIALSVQPAEQIAQDNKPKFQCPISKCGKIFPHLRDYNRHKICHIDNRPYLCMHDHCLKKYKRHFELIDHLRQIHNDAKPFKCENCPESFSSYPEFHKHQRSHIPPIKCDICNKPIRCQAELSRHLILHSNETPYQCNAPYCNRAYKYVTNLRTHLRKNHPELESNRE